MNFHVATAVVIQLNLVIRHIVHMCTQSGYLTRFRQRRGHLCTTCPPLNRVVPKSRQAVGRSTNTMLTVIPAYLTYITEDLF